MRIQFLRVCGLSIAITGGAYGCFEKDATSSETTDVSDDSSHSDEHPEFSYNLEAEDGPEHWGELSDAYATCGSGTEQSPINIITEDVYAAGDVGALTLTYTASSLSLYNNGHTIGARFEDTQTMTVDDVEYTFQQLHFHYPSEHTVDGFASALEMHLVHKDAEGNLAVIGVLFDEGEANDSLDQFWDELPGEEVATQSTDVTADLRDFLPEDLYYDTYAGSLTAPPCSEAVKWILLTEHQELSEEQAQMFFDTLGFANSRPVQSLNTRVVSTLNLPH